MLGRFGLVKGAEKDREFFGVLRSGRFYILFIFERIVAVRSVVCAARDRSKWYVDCFLGDIGRWGDR